MICHLKYWEYWQYVWYFHSNDNLPCRIIQIIKSSKIGKLENKDKLDHNTSGTPSGPAAADQFAGPKYFKTLFGDISIKSLHGTFKFGKLENLPLSTVNT